MRSSLEAAVAPAPFRPLTVTEQDAVAGGRNVYYEEFFAFGAWVGGAVAATADAFVANQLRIERNGDIEWLF